MLLLAWNSNDICSWSIIPYWNLTPELLQYHHSIIHEAHFFVLCSLAGLDKDVHAPTESHVITGPLGQTPNINIRKKRNPSVLEAAFQNAWKQGNLAAEVSSISTVIQYC